MTFSPSYFRLYLYILYCITFRLSGFAGFKLSHIGRTNNMNDNPIYICMRCIISGKVQGVFFRASTQNQAQRLGIVGHVKNLPNGYVEVIACGPQAALDKLKYWLHRGPSTAQVVDVKCGLITEQNFSNFQTL